MWRVKRLAQLRLFILAFSFLCLALSQSSIGMSMHADTPAPKASCSCTYDSCSCESQCCTTALDSTPTYDTQLSGVSCQTTAFHMEMVLLLTKGLLTPTLYAYSVLFSTVYTDTYISNTYSGPTYPIFHPPSCLS